MSFFIFVFEYGNRTILNATPRWGVAHPRLDGDDTFLIIDSRTGHFLRLSANPVDTCLARGRFPYGSQQFIVSGGLSGCTSSKTDTPQYFNDSRTGPLYIIQPLCLKRELLFCGFSPLHSRSYKETIPPQLFYPSNRHHLLLSSFLFKNICILYICPYQQNAQFAQNKPPVFSGFGYRNEI